LRSTRATAIAGVTLIALAAALTTGPARGGPVAKAFPSGCWIGSQPYSGTYASGPVNAKVTNGKLKIVVWVGSDKPVAQAVGFMTVTGAGSGSLTVAGSKLTLKVKILGDYDLTGTASAVKVNGTYAMTGIAYGSGQFLPNVPVKLKFPVKNLPLQVASVAPTHVSGLFGKAPWSATRHAGSASKSPGACSSAS
jgi:hypothetical protein